MMRLDKMLAHVGYGSRKEVKALIRKGYVLVNGECVTDDDFKVDEINDEVIIADQEVKYEHKIYLMLNKPDGYISATWDFHDPTVLDLIDGYEKRNLFPVGRLDKDTEGLLLITNDGDLAHRMLSPKSHVDRRSSDLARTHLLMFSHRMGLHTLFVSAFEIEGSRFCPVASPKPHLSVCYRIQLPSKGSLWQKQFCFSVHRKCCESFPTSSSFFCY